jgi:hypothetical protein
VIYSPSAYEDECLYSFKARLLRNTLSYPTEFSPDDIRSHFTSLDLPYHLGELYKVTKHFLPWTLKSIIDDHTLYPIYKPFLIHERQQQVIKAMISSHRMNIHSIVGINTSSLTRSRYPKFCPICGREDIKKHDEAYIHRVHQIPEIQICPNHGCFLIEYAPELSEITRKYFLPSASTINTSKVILNNCKTLSQISIDFRDLFSKESFDINEVDYFNEVQDRGYFKNGKLKRKELQEEFCYFYKETKNEYLKSRIFESYHWIGDIVSRPEKIFNPFQHLLFKRFVGQLNFKLIPKKEHPFGAGPWKCFNKSTDHYLTDSVKEMSLAFDKTNNRLVAIFKCECGMTYSKYFIQKNGRQQEQIRIKERGLIWISTMHECLAKGYSKRETARILGTDASTIVKIVKKESRQLSLEKVDKVIFKRQEWQAVINKYDFNNYSQASEKYTSLYKWLLKNDSDWLFSTKSLAQNLSTRQLRLDWRKIDEELKTEVNEIITKLREEKPNVRISKTLIGKLASNGRYILTTNLKNLPKTKDIIAQKAESIDHFQIRRINDAISIISKDRRSLTKSNILKQANIRSHSVHINRKIAKLIQTQEINHE